MKNRMFLAALALALILSGSRPAKADILEQIVVQVNSDIITLSQYNREKEVLLQAMRTRFQGADLAQRYEAARKNILSALVDEMLLVQRAKEYGFTEDLDLEANSYLEDLMKQNNIPNIDALKQEMARSGVSYDDYMENLKRQILVSRVKGAIIRQKIKVMSSEVDQYYKDHIADFTQPEQVELEEIVLYTKDRDKAEVQRRIQTAYSELQAGQKFEDLAKSFSEGATAAQGGNIGLFPIPALSATISAAIKPLQPGQVTGILEADFGYQIIRLVRRVEPVQQPLEDVRKDIENKIFAVRLEPVMAEYLKELRRESYIFVFPEFRADYNPPPDTAAPAQPPPAPAPAPPQK